MRVEVGKKGQHSKLQKVKLKKKKNPNKNTHTENGTPAHELKKKQKKKYVNDACFKGEHEELC